MKVIVFEAGKQQEAPASDLAELLERDSLVIWLDITEPDDDAIQIMRDVFHFHPLAIEDTHNHRQRPKIEEYDDHLFLIINSVEVFDQPADPRKTPDLSVQHELNFHEIDLFVGRNYIVTAHKAEEKAIEQVRRRLDNVKNSTSVTVGYLLYTILDTVVDEYFPVLDMFEQEIEDLEDTILAHPKQGHLNRLFELKHMLLHFWRVVWPERDMLHTLVQPHVVNFSGKNSAEYYLRDVGDHMLWVADMINTYRDTLTTMIDLYMSSISHQLNRFVNRLTILTLVIGILTVISGFYGMNFLRTWPPFDVDWGVPLVLLLMIVGIGGLFGTVKWLNRERL
jgi:magnesium transporter